MRKILFLSLLFAATMLSAQSPVELPLWPDGAPNTNGLTGEQEDLKGGRVANVTHPSITVYRPAKPNGMAVIMCPGGGYARLAMNHEGQAVLASGMTLTSCGDSFLNPDPASKGAAGAAGDPMNINSGLAAAYQILLLDSYAGGSYESSVYIGDIQSDDLWKGGGDAQDGMSGMNLNVSMFTTTGNSTLHGTWNIYTSGITRVNSALGLCETATTNNPAELKLISQYRGEGFFLRAYYLYMLWRSFGSVPFQETLYEPPYVGPQLSPDEVYAQIIKDVDASIASFKEAGVKYSTNGGANSGRASLAAALMLKARVVMYQKDNAKYAEAASGLAEIIASGEFELTSKYADIWVDEGEFNKESIFEANHIGEGQGLEELILCIHPVSDVRISRRRLETMEYMRHFGIIPIFVLIQLKHSLVVRINLRLVEYAQYFLQSIVYPSSQPRNLDNDAVMLQTLYKWVWLLLVYFISLIVIYLMSGIDDGFRELSHVMPQQIHRHCWQGILALGLLAHILLVVILHSQVLTEAQGLRLQPCFLQFYQNQILTAVIFQYGCSKVNTKHRDGIT